MRILWHSNGRRSPTGYGNQTDLFAPRLHKAGHHVDISAFHGQVDVVMTAPDGIRSFPPILDGYGNDAIEGHFAFCESDVVITLVDPWVLQPDVWGKLPWCAWTPIDGEPIRVGNRKVLEHARWIWGMSQFGMYQLERAGLGARATYVPHGVDTQVFRPIDRAQARHDAEVLCGRKLDGRFVVFMNAANIGTPSRKGFGYAMEAVARFAEYNPDVLLWMHTDQTGRLDGEDLEAAAVNIGLAPEFYVYSQAYPYAMGMYSPERLNIMYNAADVLLMPSLGEGFGIPLIEAQAAGTPVIGTDCSAISELVMAGWKVQGHKVYIGNGIRWTAPDVNWIVEALGAAKQAKDDVDLRRLARLSAEDYDADRVLRDFMLPAVERMADDVRAGHEHDWSPVGLVMGDHIETPCRVKDCPAARHVYQDRPPVVMPHGFEMDMNIDDDPKGGVAKIVRREIEASYGLNDIPIAPGDVIVDIGAHVGVVSIWLAKRHPDARIYAFEPVPANFERLEKNVVSNTLENITAHQLAIGRHGTLELGGDIESNSGGFSAFVPVDGGLKVTSVRLDAVLSTYNVDRIKLLKIDCEGMEYVILTDDILDRVDYLVGEFHVWPGLDRDAAALLRKCQTKLGADHVHVTICEVG